MTATETRKKKALFDETDDESDGGADLKINDEYAKRFEHNKKREELHRLEEKYKSKNPNGSHSKNKDDDEDDDSSSDETEDDDGFLATEALDAQISATLQAIKSKDPRLYDGKSTFYTPVDEDPSLQPTTSKEKKEKPVFLHDYHREKLLRGDTGADDESQETPPQTYAQEQDEIKKSLQNEIQAQLKAAGKDADSDSDDEGFMKAKEGAKVASGSAVHPSRATNIKVPVPDVKEADKNPELFLSNFLASRAWVQGDGNGWQPFESDEEQDEKADEWEAAYNMRFEDPSKSNEVLRSYARDVTASISVRREEKSGRKRQRELEKEKKEAEKKQRKEERARLRRLKVEEAESKLQKIKKTAGLRGKVLKDEEWQKLLESSWEDDQWEEGMNKFFNDEYYAEGEAGSDDAAEGSQKKKIKKPKWDDDIDIKDIVPDFDDEERPKVTLTDDEEPEAEQEEDDEDAPVAKRQKSTKERKRERLASQKEARQERAKLEALVDARMKLDDPEMSSGGKSSKNGMPQFGYIETKPESFGLTTRDILMASDADLNNFVGLKKLAHWRDPEKQSKDRKRLGKKARLRQWRKETFGPEFEREPPALDFGKLKKEKSDDAEAEGGNVIEGSKKKRKRTRPKKEGKGKEVATE
ncbi:KRI1-like family C-terminal-domain-containing protein [Xylaria sp. CBS 124048]|nr:KRI1-like family C-terminal-domain-containing protein [Xylaria sp. CBS 124048]